jgi:p-hydroxybenzoate 3-monooxygenase
METDKVKEVIRTRVGIVGAGPAGLLLARMLQLNGIDSVILERRSRAHVLARVRAGVLEKGTVDTLIAVGAGERLLREGIPHQEIQLRWNGACHRVPTVDENGRHLTTYGQAKIVEDLIRLREAVGLPIHFEAQVSRFEDLTGDPVIHFTEGGVAKRLRCDFVAGCDGFHGVSRAHIPGADEASILREYPFAWFGILADAKPHKSLRGFAHSRRGLAVASARSDTVSRLYLQVAPDFEADSMADDEIWDELDRRFADGSGIRFNRGPILEKSVARLRGFICTAMRHGKLCIAGDAAHIVPPSGAKGLNSAVGDVRVLSETIVRYLKHGDSTLLDEYSETCLRRILPTVHWSCEMSNALHMFPGQNEFDTRMQYATLESWVSNPLGQKRFREAMLGQPFQL